jgi:hypothetical protein
MSAIPVESGGSSGRSDAQIQSALVHGTPLSTAQTAAAYSGTCYKWWKNPLGAEIMRVTLKKSWSYNGTTQVNPSARFYGTAGFPYVFDGIVNSQDYYSTAYENAHGKHTSYRQGKFTDNLTGTQVNASVTFVSKLGGNYSCSFGGGI